MARRRALKREEYKSRKLWYGIGTSLFIFVSGVLAAKWIAFGVHLSTVIGGLIGAYAVYAGVNIGSKFVQGKSPQLDLPEVEPDGQPVETVPEE